MRRKELPYLNGPYRDNRGKVRLYFRRKGSPHDGKPLSMPIGSTEFMDDYRACLAGGKVAPEDPNGGGPGSLNALIASYYGTTDWAKLRKPSQDKYRRGLEWLRKECGASSAAKVERQHVMAWINVRKDTLAAADEFRKRMVALFEHAVAIDLRDDNPAAAIPAITRDRESHRWNEAEIATFEAAYPVGTPARLAFTFALEIGARGSDVIRFTRDHFAGRDEKGRQVVEFVQFKTRGKGKTKGRVSKPIAEPVQAVLDAIEHKVVALVAGARPPLLLRERGKPHTEKSFGTAFSAWRKAAGLPDELTAHGLRHARGRRLAERGCTAHEIMADMGWQTLAEAQRYCDAYSRAGAAAAAAEKVKTGTRSA